MNKQSMLPDYWYSKKISYLETYHLIKIIDFIENSNHFSEDFKDYKVNEVMEELEIRNINLSKYESLIDYT